MLEIMNFLCVCGTYRGPRGRLQEQGNSHQNPQLRHLDQTGTTGMIVGQSFITGAPPPKHPTTVQRVVLLFSVLHNV